MLADILILFADAQSESDLSQAKQTLMATAPSVIVHHKDGSDRVLLVKYDPNDTHPTNLLDAVRTAGFQANMAGG